MNKADILLSIRNLDKFLNIPDLKGAIVATNANGSIIPLAGGFNMVFKITHAQKTWALRVWHKPGQQDQKRYLAIAKYLRQASLPYFVDFIYDEKSLLVNGQYQDIIRMEWVQGLLLKEYIGNHLNAQQTLKKLAADFIKMCKMLREKHISHGDLQEGNIIIDEHNNLKLIDYDSVCISDLEGEQELVTGKEGYQHFSRLKGTAGSKLSLKSDYFSELIIYLSIIALSEKPDLWRILDGSEHLLFSPQDLEDIENTDIIKELTGLTPQIDQLVEILRIYLRTDDYRQLAPFDTYFNPPIIVLFEPAHKYIIQNYPLEIAWQVENATRIYISPQVGAVGQAGKISFVPQTDTYTLTAEGLTDNVESTFNVTVIPAPTIKSVAVPAPMTAIMLDLEIGMPKFPHLNTSISYTQPHHGIPLNNNLHISLPNFNLKSPTIVDLNVEHPDFNTDILNKSLKNKLKNLAKKVFEKIKSS